MMWNSLERPWQMSFEQGWEALKAGSIPIGAVIADESGNVISRGKSRARSARADWLGKPCGYFSDSRANAGFYTAFAL